MADSLSKYLPRPGPASKKRKTTPNSEAPPNQQKQDITAEVKRQIELFLADGLRQEIAAEVKRQTKDPKAQQHESSLNRVSPTGISSSPIKAIETKPEDNHFDGLFDDFPLPPDLRASFKEKEQFENDLGIANSEKNKLEDDMRTAVEEKAKADNENFELRERVKQLEAKLLLSEEKNKQLESDCKGYADINRKLQLENDRVHETLSDAVAELRARN